MPTQVQVRGATQATQEARTLAVREIDVNTTDSRIAIHDGSTAGGIPHANYADIQNQEWVYAAATGTDSIVISLAIAPAAYAAGQRFVFKAANTNTGSATLNVNSLGAKTIKKASNGSIVVLEAGDIVSGGIYACVYDGTDMIISGGVGSGDKSIASASPTSGSTVDFASVFSAGYNYEVRISDLTPATDNVGLWLRLTDDNGSTYESAASYQYGYHGYTSAGAANDAGGTGQTAIVLANAIGSTSNQSISGSIWIENPGSSTSQCKIHWSLSYRNASNNFVHVSGGGVYNVSDIAYTGFQLLWSSGNFEDGDISIYRKAL